MDLYSTLAYDTSRRITLGYSSSFGLSSRLFKGSIRPHIYAIYGLVRIADEVVDGGATTNAASLLDELETSTYRAIADGYSTNPVVHAFALTARQYRIDRELIEPFFASMRLDLSPQTYTTDLYRTYIYGSAEVIGLMCLKVFCDKDSQLYIDLAPGAGALGAAYQKVNFLRDMAADYRTLGRFYFPDSTFDTFDTAAKQSVVDDIRHDFATAKPAVDHLPASAKRAVLTSYQYYYRLFERLDHASVETIKQRRVRLPAAEKLWVLLQTAATGEARL